MSDNYTEVTLQWPDVKVATKLCIGGPCKYVLKEGSHLSNQWLVQNVTPGIASVYGADVAALLAKPLVWALFEDVTTDTTFVPQSIRTRIMTAYDQQLAHLPNNQNPVKKVQLIAFGEEEEVHLEEIPDDGAPQQQAGNANIHNRDNQTLATYARVAAIERKQDDFHNEYRQDKAATIRRLERLERNVQRIAIAPYQRQQNATGPGQNEQDGGGAGDQEAAAAVATLSRCPRDLYTLWIEYEYGLDGRKPARQFTARERGQVKFKYSRRKLAWDAIDRMIRSGSTAQVACDRIYSVYGREKSVTQLIECLRRDHPAGHPNLR